jgi:hypothetical protein
MKTVLTRLQQQYEQPVDIEFAVTLTPEKSGKPRLDFHLLQCRPQNQFSSDSQEIESMPTDIEDEDKILFCTRMVPQGHVGQIEYIIHVDSESYFQLTSLEDHAEVARCIGQLNSALDGHSFILVGPGRWGSSDSMQGVPVTYADIFNTHALVEVASNKSGFAAEPSYGTHFFQDLVESQIYPLAVYPEEAGDHLNLKFIHESDNQINRFIQEVTKTCQCIKLIHIPSERPGYHMDLIMDGQNALGYLTTAKMEFLPK